MVWWRQLTSPPPRPRRPERSGATGRRSRAALDVLPEAPCDGQPDAGERDAAVLREREPEVARIGTRQVGRAQEVGQEARGHIEQDDPADRGSGRAWPPIQHEYCREQ